jgi:hypothetical protein
MSFPRTRHAPRSRAGWLDFGSSGARFSAPEWARAILVTAAIACGGPDLPEIPLIERNENVPPDVGDLPDNFSATGGPVLLILTGWVKAAAIADLEAAGLLPLPGLQSVEQLDSLGLNVVGGVIPPGGLDRIAAIRYIERIELAR